MQVDELPCLALTLGKGRGIQKKLFFFTHLVKLILTPLGVEDRGRVAIVAEVSCGNQSIAP
jgi:hypothetical protein